MAAIFSDLPYNLGDYKIETWLYDSNRKDYYIAHQMHVDRRVLLEINIPTFEQIDKEQSNTQFLADAKVKASYGFERVKAIFCSTEIDNYVFNIYDMPKGTSLSVMFKNGEKLSVLAICKLIEQCAQLYQDIALQRLKTEVLSLENIFYIDDNHYEFLSPLISDLGYDASTDEEQINGLVQVAIAFLPESSLGINRLLTLLNWMDKGFEGHILPWDTLASTASLIIEQVYPDSFQKSQTVSSSLINSKQRKKIIKKRFRFSMIFLTAIFLILGISLFYSYAAMGAEGYFRTQWKDALFLQNKQSYIQAQSQATSIQNYDSFLKALSSLSQEENDKLHKGLPEEAREHIPRNWKNQLNAAENNSMYEGRRLSPNSPVVGVNYWDALLYARYNRAELPSLNILANIPRKANEESIDEWSSGKSTDPVYGKIYHIFNHSNNFQRESQASKRENNRGFRIIQKSHTQPTL